MSPLPDMCCAIHAGLPVLSFSASISHLSPVLEFNSTLFSCAEKQNYYGSHIPQPMEGTKSEVLGCKTWDLVFLRPVWQHIVSKPHSIHSHTACEHFEPVVSIQMEWILCKRVVAKVLGFRAVFKWTCLLPSWTTNCLFLCPSAWLIGIEICLEHGLDVAFSAGCWQKWFIDLAEWLWWFGWCNRGFCNFCHC